MKASFFALLFLFAYIECRKTYTPIDKKANIAFINMEGGGGSRPAPTQPAKPVATSPANPPSPVITPKPVTTAPVKPTPAAVATTYKPSYVPVKPQQPTSVKPVQPYPAPITTPGPGSVKQLVNFYDSQGKGSVIRPYSYSQAVKQG